MPAHRERDQPSAVHQSSDALRHRKRRYSNIVTECRRCADILVPILRNLRPGGFVQLDPGAVQHAEALEIVVQALAARTAHQADRADVGGFEEHLLHGQIARRDVRVVDLARSDEQGRGGVHHRVQVRHMLVQRHGEGEHLEGGAHFVGRQARAVRHGRLVKVSNVIGIKVRRIGHGEHFAGLDIGDHADRVDRLVVGHRPLQLGFEGGLNAQVDRQRDMPAARRRVANIAVEGLLRPRDSASLGVRPADDMRRLTVQRIGPAHFILERDPDDAKIMDPVLLLHRQAALDQLDPPHRHRVRHFLRRLRRQHGRQGVDRLLSVPDLAAVDIDAVQRGVEGEGPAVAVHQIRPGERHRRAFHPAANMREQGHRPSLHRQPGEQHGEQDQDAEDAHPRVVHGSVPLPGPFERVLDAPQHLDQRPPDLRKGRRGVIADEIRTIAHRCASTPGVSAGPEVAGAG